jgi:osmotically-inducible protein OsmY
MKTNVELQKDVMEELRWEPMLNAAEIGVAAKNGVITLTGTVDSYSKKLSAERAAKRVAGVKAVAEDIMVKLPGSNQRTDAEIAQAALSALRWNTSVPDRKIKLKVEDGWIFLEGEVDWQFEKDAARLAVTDLLGVRGVTNSIELKPEISIPLIKDNIKKALERNAALEAGNIKVETFDHKVVLKGTVHTWTERNEAEKAAWSAPGVISVEDELLVVA